MQHTYRAQMDLGRCSETRALMLTSLVVQELQFHENVRAEFDEPQFGGVPTAKEHSVLIVTGQDPTQGLGKCLQQTHRVVSCKCI